MRNKIALVLVLFSTLLNAIETGPIDSVMRVPHTLGKPGYGSIDLAKSATVGASVLGLDNGGTGSQIATTGLFDMVAAHPNFRLNSTLAVGSGAQARVTFASQNGAYAYIGLDQRNDRNFRFNYDGTSINTVTQNLQGYGSDFGGLDVAQQATTCNFTAGSPTLSNFPAGFLASYDSVSKTSVYSDYVQKELVTAVGANTCTVGSGESYPVGGGKFTDIVTGILYTYTAYNSTTGVFTGMTPNPSGVMAVGDQIYGTLGIPYFARISSVGATTLTMNQNATSTLTNANCYFVDDAYGHTTISQPGSNYTIDSSMWNIYAASNINDINGGNQLMLHNNDPYVTVNDRNSIVSMNNEYSTRGVPTGGMDWLIENQDGEGAQLGSWYVWVEGPDNTNVSQTISSVSANKFSITPSGLLNDAAQAFKSTGGTVHNTTRSVDYTYVTYNRNTGNFVGLSPNPSGTTQVGDTITQAHVGGRKRKAVRASNNGSVTLGPDIGDWLGQTPAHIINGGTTANVQGLGLTLKDNNGNFGTHANPSLNFVDNANTVGFEVGFSGGITEKNAYLVNRLATGHLYLATNAAITLDLDGGNNVIVGTGVLATNATAGFFYGEGTAGLPTGTPTSVTGRVAEVYDTTNDVKYAYNGAWKKVGGKQLAVGTAVTSNGSALSNTSFTAFDNTPAVTFTPSRTGTFRVWTTAEYLVTGTGGHSFGLKVVGTSGSPSTTANGELYGEIATASRTFPAYVWGLFSLTKGTAYTFTLEGKVGNGADSIALINAGPTDGVFMVAEEVN